MEATGEDAWRRFVRESRRRSGVPFSEHWTRFRQAYRDRPPEEGPPPAWWPEAGVVRRSNLLALQNQLGVDGYEALHRFSVERREEFWAALLERVHIEFEQPPDRILDLSGGPENPRWLPGARLNITESCFGAAPEKPAILFGREDGRVEAVSYEALERDVARFAGGVRACGLVPDEGVVLYMPMTPECIVAYLGTIRAGCRVVSVADSFSAEELRGRIEIAGARAVVTLSAYRRGDREIELYSKVKEARGGLSETPVAVVVEPGHLEKGDVSWAHVMSPEHGDLEPHVSDPDHVTNVLFSSGTTGTPKAIPWTQLTPLKAGMDAHLHQDVHPDDVICWPTNIGWMMGPWLVYAALLNRATMALYEGPPTGAGFSRFVREAGVTVLGVVPSIVRSWRAGDAVDAGAWPAMRLFSSTGEASGTEDYLWLMSRTHYRAPVVEYLGGTEIGGGHLTGTVLQPASPATFSTAALGVDVVILGEDQREVREGEMGELYLVPPALGLSQELLNRDHHAVYYEGCPPGPNGEVLRRHGDHIARLARGYYKAHGRADDTMNLGGIKVSSIELERVVNAHPAVHESAAVAVQAEGGGADRLVIFAVLEERLAEGDLKVALGQAIATHLNPLFKVHDVVEVEALPRTASNKIMRRSLRATYAGQSQDS